MIRSFGHSTLSSSGALEVLRGTETLVDIRSHPTSKWPQWRKESLEYWVSQHGMKYVWLPELGGWDVRHANLVEAMDEVGLDIRPYIHGHFPKGVISRKLDLPLPAWTVGGFWDFQWFMTIPEFRQGIDTLLSFDAPAMMCAELLPWSCHRSMVADYLLHVERVDVLHLQPRQANHSKWPSRVDRYDRRVRRGLFNT